MGSESMVISRLLAKTWQQGDLAGLVGQEQAGYLQKRSVGSEANDLLTRGVFGQQVLEAVQPRRLQEGTEEWKCQDQRLKSFERSNQAFELLPSRVEGCQDLSLPQDFPSN